MNTLLPPPPPPVSQEPPSAGQPPLLAGRYELGEMLGSGGMAWVYKARDVRLDRDVAVKILRPQFARLPRFRERFLEEARLAAKLNHPHLVTIYDVDQEGDRVFMVMEYVPGTTLAHVIRQEAPLSLEEALHLMVQACAGVGYVHRSGLVHGDLKPSNLLVTPDRRIKVTDFGIAGAVGVLLTETTESGQQMVWGSPRYLSPEHARGEPLVPASDVYSLGLLLYEMLTGRLPYQAHTPEEWAQAHAFQQPTPPRRYRPDLPPRLEQVLLKVLSKRPGERYRTADHLGRILLLFTEREETRAVPLPEAQKTVQVQVPPAAPQREQGEPPRAGEETPAPRPSPQATPTPPPAPGPAPAAPRTPSVPSPPQTTPRPWTTTPRAHREEPLLDAFTLFLGLLAAMAVAGLIPLWVWVYLLYR